MVNSSLKTLSLIVIFLLSYMKHLYSKGIMDVVLSSKNEVIIILIIIGFFIIIGLFLFIILIKNLRRENVFRFYLNFENMWNSTPMLEARQKCSTFITDDLIHSQNEQDKIGIKYAKVIIDFFNHIGLQVYQDIIDFEYTYNMFAQEIMDYWDTKNYKLLVHYEKHKMYPTDMNPWVGFEYLADLCFQQKEYLRGQLWIPASFPPMNYQPLPEKVNFSTRNNHSSSPFNVYLIIFTIVAFFSLLLFVFSYLFYSGYL